MSGAMEIHDAIGSAMTIVLTGIACAFPFAVVYFMARYYLMGPPHDRALDVINSQYLSADGKSYDWSKGDLPQGMYGAPRARIQVAAYRNFDTEYDKGKGVVMPPEPEDDEEETTTASDFPEDENTDAPTIEFTVPDIEALKAIPPPKTLKAKTVPPW